MIGLNEEAPATETAAATTSPENHRPAAEPVANGAAGQAPTPEAAAAQAEESAADERAVLVDRMAQRVGFVAAWGVRKLVTLASRTREAVQDFWADVQDFRHGRNSAELPESKPEPADDGTGR